MLRAQGARVTIHGLHNVMQSVLGFPSVTRATVLNVDHVALQPLTIGAVVLPAFALLALMIADPKKATPPVVKSVPARARDERRAAKQAGMV